MEYQHPQKMDFNLAEDTQFSCLFSKSFKVAVPKEKLFRVFSEFLERAAEILISSKTSKT
jgi:hypothetical protein